MFIEIRRLKATQKACHFADSFSSIQETADVMLE